MEQAFLTAIRVLAALDALHQTDQFALLRADIDALNAKVRESLPSKPDGSSYTDEDIAEALARANAPLDAIDQRHGAGG